MLSGFILVNGGGWIYPSSNFSNSHSPSRSIHGVLFVLVSSTLHTQKPCSLSSPPYFLQTTHIHPPLPQLLTHLCISPTHTSYIPSPHPHPKPVIRLPIILQAVLTRPRVRGCTFLFVVGKCSPPQPLDWLVPMFCCCHHEDFIGAHSFYGEHALAYPQPQFSGMSGPETKASPMFFEKCGGKLAREGRDTTP